MRFVVVSTNDAYQLSRISQNAHRPPSQSSAEESLLSQSPNSNSQAPFCNTHIYHTTVSTTLRFTPLLYLFKQRYTRGIRSDGHHHRAKRNKFVRATVAFFFDPDPEPFNASILLKRSATHENLNSTATPAHRN